MVTKKSLGILWKHQYVPREKFIKKNLNTTAQKKWNKQTKSERITVIDRLQAKGFFKKWGF